MRLLFRITAKSRGLWGLKHNWLWGHSNRPQRETVCKGHLNLAQKSAYIWRQWKKKPENREEWHMTIQAIEDSTLYCLCVEKEKKSRNQLHWTPPKHSHSKLDENPDEGGKKEMWGSLTPLWPSTSQQMDKISSIPHEYTLFQRRHRPHTHIWSGKVSQPFHQWSPSAVSNHSENKEKKQVLFLYIDIPSPSFPSRWLFLIPSLGSCELADVDYSINSLFIYLSVHPLIDSSLPFQCRGLCYVWINSPYKGARERTAERFKPEINGKFQKSML